MSDMKVGDVVVITQDTGSRIPNILIGKRGVVMEKVDSMDGKIIVVRGYPLSLYINGTWFVKPEDLRKLTKLEKALK